MAQRDDIIKISNDAESERFIYIQKLIKALEKRFESYLATVVAFGIKHDAAMWNAYIDGAVKDIVGEVEAKVIVGLNYGWQASMAKNDSIGQLLDKDYVGLVRSDALKVFQNETVNGLNLKETVFKPFSAQIKAGMEQGIAEGKSAAEITRDLTQYLKNPDSVPLKKEYKPGQGISRSATKNVKRMVAQVINSSYRKADLIRWSETPFVLGFEVRLSASHPKFDMCDNLAGDYPSTFMFTGWHVYCLCFTIPKLMSKEQFAKYQQLVLNGTDAPEAIKAIVTPVMQIPETALNWVQENSDKIGRLKTEPYWIRDNKKLFKSVLGTKKTS